MAKSLRQETVNGIFWSSVERFSVQGIQFLVMLVMARLLTPKDYGIVGMITVFIGFAEVLIDSGFSQALIRKKERSEIDNCTVFYFNIISSIFLYFIMYFSAPLVAGFYSMESLEKYVRVVCLAFIINAIAIVPRANYTANVDFKTQTKASIWGVVSSSAVGISLALLGFGPWAIVFQLLTNQFVSTIFLFIYSKWKPKLLYSWKSFNEMFAFGSKLLATGIINAIYSNLYTIVIAKLFSPTVLGNYSRAQQCAQYPSSNLTQIFQRVTFPILCKANDDLDRLESIYRKMLRCAAYVVFPLMVGMSALAKPLVIFLIGEQWINCIYLLQIVCFSMMWYPIHAINLDILQVSGRSDLFLKVEIYKKVIGVSALLASAPFGIVAMCYVGILNSLICLYINNYYTARILKITLWTQFGDFMHIIFLCGLMFFSVYAVTLFIAVPWLSVILGIIVGGIVYIGGSYVFHFDELAELIRFFKK